MQDGHGEVGVEGDARELRRDALRLVLFQARRDSAAWSEVAARYVDDPATAAALLHAVGQLACSGLSGDLAQEALLESVLEESGFPVRRRVPTEGAAAAVEPSRRLGAAPPPGGPALAGSS